MCWSKENSKTVHESMITNFIGLNLMRQFKSNKLITSYFYLRKILSIWQGSYIYLLE